MQDQLHTFGRNGDFVQRLVDHQVDFLVVGGLAVVFHGCRDAMAVDDLDLMLNPSQDNAQRFLSSLTRLALSAAWSVEELSKPNIQLPIKRDFYLDVLTPPDGIEYEALKQRSSAARLNNIPVQVVSREDLIALKRRTIHKLTEEARKHENDLRCLEAV